MGGLGGGLMGEGADGGMEGDGSMGGVMGVGWWARARLAHVRAHVFNAF